MRRSRWFCAAALVLASSLDCAIAATPGVISITSGPTATPSTLFSAGTDASGTIFPGGTSTIAGVLKNTGTGTQDSVNWRVVAGSSLLGAVPGSPNTGLSLAQGSTANLSFTYQAGSNLFGLDGITLTPSGTGANGSGPATATGASVNVMVVGIANRGGVADGNGTPGVSTGNLLATSPFVAGTSLNGFETRLSGNSKYGIGSTDALIQSGTLGSSTVGVAMEWRSRANIELPSYTEVHGGTAVISDVSYLDGITGGSNSVFSYQMSYDPTQLANELTAAANGQLYLGYRSADDGHWHNAVATGFTDGQIIGAGQGGQAVQDFQGSWQSFVAGPGNGYALPQLLGSYGVDTANHTAWAVIDHNGHFPGFGSGMEFAVVTPEPGTLALLAAGAIGLVLVYRRRAK